MQPTMKYVSHRPSFDAIVRAIVGTAAVCYLGIWFVPGTYGVHPYEFNAVVNEPCYEASVSDGIPIHHMTDTLETEMLRNHLDSNPGATLILTRGGKLL